MKIALDYDDTYTADPDLWDQFIKDCTYRGHVIMIVTFRSPLDKLELPINIPVFYTNYTGKRQFMENRGIYIDVWIDDTPDYVVLTR